MADFERVQHVRNQVQRIGGRKAVSRLYTMICCPFHADGTPSGRITHDETKRGVGFFRCYACGHTAKWNELAEKLGLDPFPNTQTGKVPHFNAEVYDAALLGTGDADKTEQIETFPLGPKAMRRLRLDEPEWRGFSFDFLKSVGAELCCVTKEDFSERYYLYLPVNVKGKRRGYIKALPHKVDGLPGYFNAPGAWSRKYGLFLYDESVALMRKKKLRTLVLAEGPRDGLRLYRAGIPAISILGTQSWSKRKIELLEETDAEKIILCMDGDKAGRQATRLLYSGMQKFDNSDREPQRIAPPLHETFRVEDFNLKDYLAKGQDKIDPYEAPERAIEDLVANLE